MVEDSTNFYQPQDPSTSALAYQLMQKMPQTAAVYQPKQAASGGGGGGLFGLGGGGGLPGMGGGLPGMGGGGGGLPGMGGGDSAASGTPAWATGAAGTSAAGAEHTKKDNPLISKGLPLAGAAIGGALMGWWSGGTLAPVGAALGSMAGTYLSNEVQK